MNFTPIEWMALLVIIFVGIKILVILAKPQAWNNSIVKKLWAKPSLMMFVSLILAGGSLYYLVDGGITIIQILAVMFFFMFLAAIGVAVYKKEVIALADKLMKDKKIIKRSWLYILIWVALLVWGAKELFAL